MKQGGDTNTIQVVNDTRALTSHLFDLPPSSSVARHQFSTQSVFYVKQACSPIRCSMKA